VTLNSETFLHEWSSHYARCRFYIVPLPVTQHLWEPQRRWSSWWQFLPESTSLTQSSLVFSRRKVLAQWRDIGREALKEWSLHQAKDKAVVAIVQLLGFYYFSEGRKPSICRKSLQIHFQKVAFTRNWQLHVSPLYPSSPPSHYIYQSILTDLFIKKIL